MKYSIELEADGLDMTLATSDISSWMVDSLEAREELEDIEALEADISRELMFS